MAIKQSELPAALAKVADQVSKGIDEVVAEIANLQTQIGDAPISDAAQASLDRLGVLAQKLDDLNPDVTPPAP